MKRLHKYDFRRFLHVRNAYAGSISPSGKQVAFLYDVTGVPQVWITSIDGQWPDQVTYFEERVSGVKFSPDGSRLVFIMDAGGNERHGIHGVLLDGYIHDPIQADPNVIHLWGDWSPDGRRIAYTSNKRDPRFFDVYIKSLDGGDPIMVLQDDGTNSVPAWSPDARHLIVSRSETNLDNNIYLLDLESGDRKLLSQHEGEALFVSPHFIGPDKLIVASNKDREFVGVAEIDLNDGNFRYLIETDWDVDSLAVSKDGSKIVYALNEDGYSRLYIWQDGHIRALESIPSGVLAQELELSDDGSTLILSMYSPSLNLNVWAVDVSSDRCWQVTYAGRAGIPDDVFAEPRLIRYRSFDGLEIPAFLYLPPDKEPPLPVVVHVHGGPESQARPIFNASIQYLVHHGFAVLAPNVRGSTGYGKSYTHLDDVYLRMNSVADLKAAADWLVESGIAQEDKIAIMGGSYGGFMVLSAITTYPDVWAAAVDIVGIANFVTFLENTGPWRRKLREAEYGSLENDREFLESISPINHVDKISCPLLVVHGANDPRVPVGEAEQIVDSLRARGMEVEYIRFEDEGHGVVKLPNRIYYTEQVVRFLDKHLGS